MQDSEIIYTVRRLRKLKSQEREVKNELDGIRALLKDEFKARGTDDITVGRYRVRRVEQEREVFDVKRFRQCNPDTYAAFCKTQTLERVQFMG